MTGRLAGRVALVTGAARGIGRGIAQRLAAEGATVAVNDFDAAGAEVTAATIAATGAKAFALPADLADPAACDHVVDVAADRGGGLDILVNNAGLDLVAAAEEISAERWERLHHVDLRAPFLLTRHARPFLAARGCGAVVNIGSVHATLTLPHRSAYAAAKGGVLSLTRALALELGPDKIRVNTVVPGYVETEIWELWLARAPDRGAALAEIRAQHPLGRYGTPSDIGAAVAFLVSDDAAFVTGVELRVDGGHSIQLVPPPV